MEKFDLIIVGAGLVGCSLACALQDTDIRVALVEKHPLDLNTPPNLNTRPISLSYASQQFLNDLNIWPLLADKSTAITEVAVSNRGSFGVTHFTPDELDLPALGYVTPYSLLHHSLFKAALENANVQFFQSGQIDQLNIDNGVTLHTHQQTLQADCLVAADGSHSSIRDQLAIATTNTAHQQTAFTAKVTTAKPHQGKAFERFNAPGVLAALPLWEPNRVNIVWSLECKQAEQLFAKSEEDLLAHLQHAFGFKLGLLKQLEKGSQFPLVTQIAKKQITKHTVLLGNAAHTLYPIAAQGFNLSLQDTMALAEQFISGKQQGLALGDTTILEAYWQARQCPQQQLIKFIQATENVFYFPYCNALKGKALATLNQLPWLKKRLAQKTTGLNQ